jgi:3-methyladenine DNA glycosylase/8-oxoguanine DNA glycosylase
VRAWPVAGAVRLGAESASGDAAAHAVERMRFALNLDHDLRPFHRQFKNDPLIGPVIRRHPALRPTRRAMPFEALAWAITEQLIETTRAFAIQRRLTYRYGRPSACGTLRDAPAPAALAARAPYELAALDLAAKRATALIKASHEVERGRVDLNDHERAWKRLLPIPNIGSWTIDCLAFHGQGRDDMLPAGDLAYVKLVGRLARLGRRATEGEVRQFFAPYGEWAGLAGTYMLRAAADRPYLRAA